MSRSYSLVLEVRGISEGQIREYMGERFNCPISITDSEYDDTLAFDCEVTLCGGQQDNEAHEEIAEYFVSLNPKAKVKTKWTDLENIPYEEYGDEDFDDEDFDDE